MSESICNWPYCTKKGEFKQRLGDGKVWAIFCKNHEAQYITGPRPSGVIDMWIKATRGSDVGNLLKKWWIR